MFRLRGNAPATVDEKGRLKLPSTFKPGVETLLAAGAVATEGPRASEAVLPRHYLTSLDGACARLYPMPVWEAIEARLEQLPATNPAKRRFLEVTSFYGSEVEPDAQGRFVIPPILREAAGIRGEVVVLGQMDHLAIWNRSRFEQRLAADPLTPEDLDRLAELGI